MAAGRAAPTRGEEAPHDWSGKLLASRCEATPQQTLPTPAAWVSMAHQIAPALAEDVATAICKPRFALQPGGRAGHRERIRLTQGQTSETSA